MGKNTSNPNSKPDDSKTEYIEEKMLQVALRVGEAFRRDGYEAVIVGGSAIEIYTSGDYTSGDVDIAWKGKSNPPLRDMLDIVKTLGGKASNGRCYIIDGIFVDFVGELESLARTPLTKIEDRDGNYIFVNQPEELLAERVLVSIEPEERKEAKNCAKKLVLAGLKKKINMDWNETKRIAGLNQYRVEKEVEDLIRKTKEEIAKEGNEYGE